ncbi:MAG: reverse transcriptase-like protein [Sphingomonadales bacterium]|nr:reverse transcriptase-like protein [Sphingomonadales bacterium]
MQRRIKVYFDGGCRPNPGPMEAAVVVRGAAHFFDAPETGSSTAAEWRALACAIGLVRELGLRNVELIGDSREVTREAAAALAGGEPASAHSRALLALVGDDRPARVRWIRRGQNLAGIALEARRKF